MGAFTMMAMSGTLLITALAGVDLTEKRWLLVGQDTQPWTAKLIFETQTPNGDDFDISGHLDWLDNTGAPRGQEIFSGSLSADGVLDFTSHTLVCPIQICAGAIYHAQLSPAGDAIVNGTWRGGNCQTGTWAAVSGPCPDIVPNGSVDEADLVFLLNEYGAGACPKGCPVFCVADLDGDGKVNVLDLIELLLNWGICAEAPSSTRGSAQPRASVAHNPLSVSRKSR